MERTQPRRLTSDEEDILDALHFVLSYDELRRETKLNKPALDRLLPKLIAEELVDRLEWNDEKKEYYPIDSVEKPFVETSLNAIDNESQFFLATKKGLFLHHSA
jgi:DNA-binding transcriptional regulator GbsR (MarR family)